jgi:radical SAM superfamily enzyme YgiQ (UPF0313 family)
MKLKIALGDLRHNAVGRHSNLMPIGIGYIASHAFSNLGADLIDIRLYIDADTILKDIEDWQPDVVGLSNYIWNSEVSGLVFRHAKRINPNIVCIAGGSEFPIEKVECRDYLIGKKEIDFYCYQEGEIAFSKLISKLLCGFELDKVKSEPQKGMMALDPVTGEIITGEPIPRIMDLDSIPSPYLNGLMDQWFDSRCTPAIQTTRGCPFTCGYCRAGISWYSPIAKFSVRRVKNELDYIFEKVGQYTNPATVLFINDSDFGMTVRDEIIAEYIGILLNKYNWPSAFNVTTGKANYDRIIHVAELLQNKAYITVSVQSLNIETLKAIQRTNLDLDEYRDIFVKLKKLGMPSFSELIIPMPNETKDSFLNAVRELFDVGVQDIMVHTTMLLKGTLLASREYREKYGLKTKFRLAARQFGQYSEEKCFEIEEVCVETNTMSFQDYLECRGFSLILMVLAGTQYDIIARHLKELGLDKFRFFIRVWELIKSGGTDLSSIYASFIEETGKELWSSRESILEYFSGEINYQKLLSSELGDNLLRKYRTKLLLEKGFEMVALLYFVITEMMGNKLTDDIERSLFEAEKWILATRNVGSAVSNQLFRRKTSNLFLLFDINDWYSSSESQPLIFFKKSVVYEISYDFNMIEKILAGMEKSPGGKIDFALGKYFMDHTERNFWGKSKVIV